MRQYIKILVRGLVVLVAAMAMAGVAQASAPLLPFGQPSPRIPLISKTNNWHQNQPMEKAQCLRPILLAQKNAPAPEKPISPPAPAAEPEKMKQADAPAARMEKSYKMNRDDDFERAGTRKLGGEVIRHKDE